MRAGVDLTQPTGNPVIGGPYDSLYDGLNYQIEHHRFPSMARGQLREVAPFVWTFCRERGIASDETSGVRSCVEIFRSLRAAAAPLRTRRPITPPAQLAICAPHSRKW